MKNLYKNLGIILFIALFSQTAVAQNKADLIDSMLQRSNRLGLFNGNVLVVDGGKIIYKDATGYADASKQTLLSTDYRFHIGSIAKEFNAVSIMMLKEQGELSVKDKISKFFPEWPKWADSVSVENLLQYTSGIPDVKWKTVKGDADALADLMRLQKLDFVPGSHYHYNNNNVFIQRRIIEKVTGLSFNKFVEEKILKPTGMKTAVIDPVETTPLMAKSYNNAGKQGELIYPITGWVAVTLDDFYKWEQALENFKLISPASTRELLTPFAPGKQCGLGGGNMQGDKIIDHQHDGTSLNYQALLTANTPAKRTVITLTNNKQNNLYDINRAITAILDGKPFQQPKKMVIDAMQNQLDSLRGVKILSAYTDLKSKHADDYNFSDEAALNTIGYYLLNQKRVDDAIVIFEYNTKLFPKSGNVFDSLAEAYNNQGNKEKALVNYKRSLQLDPTNQTAKAFIEQAAK